MFSRQREITGRWERLLERLQGQKQQTACLQAVLSLLQEVESASSQLKELQVGPAPAALPPPRATQQVHQHRHSRGPSALGLQQSPVPPGQVLAGSTACGQQLAETVELLQKHDLLEAQVSAHGAHVHHLALQSAELDDSLGGSVEVLQAKAQALAQLHRSLVSLVRAR